MDKLENIKLAFVAIFTMAGNWLGILAMPAYMLVLTNVVDYFTGLVAAKHRGERISSEIGFWGIFKKISMWVLVWVGYELDFIISTLAQLVHIDINIAGIIPLVTILWLMINELISILENIRDIGVEIVWLNRLIQLVLEKTEETAQAALPADTQHREV
ncbi:MAG: phage holin family protein [Oscillospiraceae bacterium]|nr:phage holin family protein [Oscillospiraceae bacterium]